MIFVTAKKKERYRSVFICSFLSQLLFCLAALFWHESRAEAVATTVEDFDYHFIGRVNASRGSGKKVSGLYFSEKPDDGTKIPKKLLLFVDIVNEHANKRICFELASSGGNHIATWSIQTPQYWPGKERHRISIDLIKAMKEQTPSVEEKRISQLRSLTTSSLAIKSWLIEDDNCRNDLSEDLEYLPIRWTDNPPKVDDTMIVLLQGDKFPKISAEWTNVSAARNDCTKLDLEQSEHFDHACKLDIRKVDKTATIGVTIIDANRTSNYSINIIR